MAITCKKLLHWERYKGFFCRDFDEKAVLDLYEYRGLLKEQSITLACARATQAQCQEMSYFLNDADVLAAIKFRDSVAAVSLMGEHVGHRREQIVQLIRQVYGSIYTGNTPKLHSETSSV